MALKGAEITKIKPALQDSAIFFASKKSSKWFLYIVIRRGLNRVRMPTLPITPADQMMG